MDFYAPKYRRDPNVLVHSLYQGVGPDGTTVTRLVKPSLDGSGMEVTQTYSPGLPRGQGGQAAVLILGGLETTLDEMEYILETRKQKPFVPRRTQSEIVEMCYLLLERRNSLIRHYQKNPSEAPKRKRRARLYLPVGYRMIPSTEPGLKIAART